MLLYVASKGDHANLTLCRCTIFLAPLKPTRPHCPSEHIPSLHLPLTRSPRSSLPSYARLCCHIRIVSPSNWPSSLPSSRHACSGHVPIRVAFRHPLAGLLHFAIPHLPNVEPLFSQSRSSPRGYAREASFRGFVHCGPSSPPSHHTTWTS